MIPAVIGLRDMNEASPPSITSSEIQANAGIGSKSAIRRARAKVAIYAESRLVCAPTIVYESIE